MSNEIKNKLEFSCNEFLENEIYPLMKAYSEIGSILVSVVVKDSEGNEINLSDGSGKYSIYALRSTKELHE